MGLLKWPALLSLTSKFVQSEIVHSTRLLKVPMCKVKSSKRKEKPLIDCVSNKKYNHSCDLILSFLKVFFWEKSELSRTRVIWLNLSIENLLNISRPWKFIFENLHSFFYCYKVMTKDNNGYLRALHLGLKKIIFKK